MDIRTALNLLEAPVDPAVLRAEILRLQDSLPHQWKDEQGHTCWKIHDLGKYLDQNPNEDLEGLLAALQRRAAYLKANPKAIIQKTLGPSYTRKQKTTLLILGQRVGPKFVKWLNQTFADEGPAEVQAILKDKTRLADNLSEYLKDELQIDVRDDGLIEFWGLDREKEKLIADLPVALFHYTASGVAKSIRANGLTKDNESVNYTKTPGVYLTTEQSGNAIDGYARNARAKHGGQPIMITVKAYLSELSPDDDDADISSGRHQFVVDHVPLDRIVKIEKIHV